MAGFTKKSDENVEIGRLKRKSMTLRLIGETPLFLHAMSAKAKRELHQGGTKLSTAEKAAKLKHDPRQEFLDAAYVSDDPDSETLLDFPAAAFKAALLTAALETNGLSSSSGRRLIFIPQDRVPLWGTPLLRCDIVRNSDPKRTPDVRTRPFLPEWAMEIECLYMDRLSDVSMVNLAVNAGLVAGLGDFRQEKGRGSFGAFRVVLSQAEQDVFDRIRQQGRAVQEAAMADPVPANSETAQLLEEFDTTMRLRSATAPTFKSKAVGKAAPAKSNGTAAPANGKDGDVQPTA